MAATFREAFDAARARHGPAQWLELPSRDQVELIYREMRRIDIEMVSERLPAVYPFPGGETPRGKTAGTFLRLDAEVLSNSLATAAPAHPEDRKAGA